MHFRKLKGRKAKALADMFDDIVIIELEDGTTYGGLVDEFFYDGGKGVLCLFDPKLLDSASNTWGPHDIELFRKDPKPMRDLLPEFWISDIRNVYVFSEELRDKCSVDDALQMYVDPHYKPLFVKVNCKWPKTGEHTDDCEAHLHEALSFLMEQAQSRGSSGEPDPDEWNKKLRDSFARIRRRLLVSGARIP